MADTGHIAIEGFKAGAIKYVVIEGFNLGGSAPPLNACVISEGFGVANTHKIVLDGFCTNPSSGGGGTFSIFGGYVLNGGMGPDGWL